MVVGVATTRARHRLPSGSIPVLSQRLLISQGLVIDVAYRPRVRSRNRGDGIKTLSHTRHTRAGHDFPRPGRRAAIRAGAGRAKTDKKNDESTKNEGAGKRYAKISFHISTVNRRRCGTRAADARRFGNNPVTICSRLTIPVFPNGVCQLLIASKLGLVEAWGRRYSGRLRCAWNYRLHVNSRSKSKRTKKRRAGRQSRSSNAGSVF